MKRPFAAFCHDENGATAIEYAFIASMVSIVIVSAVVLLGDQVSAMYMRIVNAFS